MGNVWCVAFGCIDQASVGVVERWGRFEKLAQPGFHLFNPFAGECLAGVLSTRISSLDVRIETKTKVFIFGGSCLVLQKMNENQFGNYAFMCFFCVFLQFKNQHICFAMWNSETLALEYWFLLLQLINLLILYFHGNQTWTFKSISIPPKSTA